MGLRLLEALLQSDVTIDTLASCLGSSNTIRTLINHSADKRAALHNLARQVLFATSEAGKRTPQAALPFLKALIEKPGSIQFDALTKTKTIESLVLSLEGVDIQTYIADLEARLSAAAVEVPSTDDEDPTQ